MEVAATTAPEIVGNAEYEPAMTPCCRTPATDVAHLRPPARHRIITESSDTICFAAFLLRSRTNRLVHRRARCIGAGPRLPTSDQPPAAVPRCHRINETEPQAKGVYDPFALADERDYVHRFHYDDSRGLLALDDPQGALGLSERFQELWEASYPAASATTLGL